MPKLAVIAATATGLQPASSLTIGGQNVLSDGTQRYGAPLESIEVVEAGPGGVSSLECSIDDPQKTIGIGEGMAVFFWNHTTDTPRFRGYVDHWSYEPGFGGQGRTIKVSCTGVEGWLDWIRMTVDPGLLAPRFLQENIGKLANANAPMLRSSWDPSGGAPWTRAGSFSYPTGNLFVNAPTQRYIRSLTLPTFLGLTLREAIQALYGTSQFWDNTLGEIEGIAPLLFTVDFYMGLRVWEDVAGLQPDDYTTLTITDTTAGVLVAENLQHAVEPGDPIRSVYVAGGNAAGTGVFGDGTGIAGRMEYINDVLILDADTARRRALTLMTAASSMVRGSFTLSDFVPASTVHAGSVVNITDAATGQAGVDYRIYQIRKRFTGMRETWDVGYGGLPPSASRLIRKLTRAVAA